MEAVKHVIREATLFAGIRSPITSRAELLPRIAEVTQACGDNIAGPLTHIFRYDTPVEGFDSEIGYPVTEAVNVGAIRTHTLRPLHFFSVTHRGPVETLRETSRSLYAQMDASGLAPELELVEVYHAYDPQNQAGNVIEIQGAFLAWPEVYRQQLLRVLGPELADAIWAGGEALTPFTPVDERVVWVARSLERLKAHTTPKQQFDILSRVALVRPSEDVLKYKRIYEESGGDIEAVIEAQDRQLASGPTGGCVDRPWLAGNVLHDSKVPYNRKAYAAATTPEETRRAYCFCTLIREATDPQVDPIFCYRAAGWARQFWEPILGVEFKRCTLTHSILKGDKFCAWDYEW